MRVRNRLNVIVGASMGVCMDVYAALPTATQPPGGTVAQGDFFGYLEGYAKYIIPIAAVFLGVWAIFVVVKNVIAKYSEASERGGSMGPFAVHAIVGGVMVGLVIFAMNYAVTIIA